ncbi:MAG: sialate O-acetylesterase [Akkermansiaceae bacterium]
MKRKLFLGLLGVVAAGATLTAKPLKVYILAGQSNMEGHAKTSSFDHIGMDPKSLPMLKDMRNADGSAVTVDDTWISYRTGKEDAPVAKGQLTAGFGARRDPSQSDDKIGPEFTFGIYTRQMVDGPILIIKTAWGGKSINTDFRPPSAGPYPFNENELANFKKQGKDLEAEKAKKKEATGRYYRMMMEHVKAVLSDPGKVHPGYNAKEGYQLCGFVWFQGWNDMVAGSVYPNRGKPGGYDAYSEVLAHFIRDVRKDLKSPKLPFVIGVMGAGGPTADYESKRYVAIHQSFRDAMAAPASMPEFKGNVAAVLTENYWDPELSKVSSKRGKIGGKRRELQKAGMKGAELKAAMDKFEAELFTARDRELMKGITNAEYHYLGSAKILGGIGKGFAEAVHKLNQ